MYDQRWSPGWVASEFESEAKDLIFSQVLAALDARVQLHRGRDCHTDYRYEREQDCHRHHWPVQADLFDARQVRWKQWDEGVKQPIGGDDTGAGARGRQR